MNVSILRRHLIPLMAISMLTAFNSNSAVAQNCTATTITPYLNANNSGWQQTSNATVASGNTVIFGPQPSSGGSWTWTGCGTSGNAREQTKIITSSCTATATYKNSCGASKTQNFTVTVAIPNCASAASDPDGDGWGWENNQSCKVTTPVAIPNCASAASDPDGDGWGWENNQSCKVTTPVTGTSGCGSAARFATGLQSLNVNGAQRNYWIEMPANYDRNKTYPVIIGLHWRGASAADVYSGGNFYGLKGQYGNNAIFLAPQGLEAGWANSGDRDIRFMRSMISEVQQGVCTDPKRVFATGFSFGGMMSNAIGCQMGDVVRAIVPMAGSLWSGCASSSNKVAAMFIHAKDDNTVPYSAGEEARNTFRTRNSCSSNTRPVGNNGCVEYQGCTSGKPVVWCGTETGGHWYPGFSAQESKAFFDRFN